MKALGRCTHTTVGSGPAGTEVLRCGKAADAMTDLGPRCRAHAHAQRTRAIILAERMTLDRSERHDLAEFIVGHTGSWSTLTEADARRVADALTAYPAVQFILNQRKRST